MRWFAACAAQVLYDNDGELKVLLAWSANTVLVCFRGSTTAANWVADAMVSRPHGGQGTARRQLLWRCTAPLPCYAIMRQSG